MAAWFVYYSEKHPAEIVEAEKAIDAVRHPGVPFTIARADGLCYPPDLDTAKKVHRDLRERGKT
jgi:hypothetical protein